MAAPACDQSCIDLEGVEDVPGSGPAVPKPDRAAIARIGRSFMFRNIGLENKVPQV